MDRNKLFCKMLWPRLEGTNEEFSDPDILHYVIYHTLNSESLASKLSPKNEIYNFIRGEST